MLRKDLEGRISEKLLRLSNESAQRLAEDYASIRYPERFPHFAFRAFSPEGKSRSGWPDAALAGVDGKIDGVEATHTADSQGVEKHLNEYLEKARERDNSQLGGFIHVSVSPKAAFTPEKIADWTNKFVEMGLDRNRVQLVFGQTLVRELAAPEFARTRMEILGIAEFPDLFQRYMSGVGPDERRLGTRFIPNWEEYAARSIHRPAAADVVAEKLSSDRIALVRGIGASGKTVLAWLLAQDVIARGFPAYHFDFATAPDAISGQVNQLSTDLKLFAHPEILFVIDNVHIDETSAKEIHHAWEEIPKLQRPRLLLVGRETRTVRGSALADRKIAVVPLLARQAELRGVFLRLAYREFPQEPVLEPPEAELSNWLKTFGDAPEKPAATADLIVFSAAVSRRINDLLKGQWKLTHQDAIEEVRDVYLRKLSDNERLNLIRLCVLQEYEVPLPSDALADQYAEFTTCNTKLGIVFRNEVGRNREYTHYSLVHAALATLILAAVPERIDRIRLIRETSLQGPSIAGWMAWRLALSNEDENSKMILEDFFANPDNLLIFSTLLELNKLLHFARKKIILQENMGAEFVRNSEKRNRLRDMILRTPLGHVGQFLRFADAGFPNMAAEVKTVCCDPANHDRLVKAALDTPLEHLTHFLRYADKEMEDISAALNRALCDPANHDRLVKAALDTPLEHLTHFLRYAKTEMRPAYDALVKGLSAEGSCPDLVKAALDTPLGDLTHFLRYAKTEMRPAYDALVKGLSAEGNCPDLVKAALDTPLEHLTHFLRYADKEMEDISEALNRALCGPANHDKLVKAALDTPLEHLTHFLRYAKTEMRPAYDALVKGLSAEGNCPDLVKAALDTPLEHLTHFLRYADKEMEDISEVLNRVLCDPANHDKLVKAALDTPLEHLTHFLRYAKTEMRPAYDALVKGLSAEGNCPDLVKAALDTPLGDLTHFLRYADKEMEDISEALNRALCDPANHNKLVKAALDTPLEHLTHFLRYATYSLRDVFLRLSSSFSCEAEQVALSKRMTVAPIYQLTTILKGDIWAEIFGDAFSRIGLPEWEKGQELAPMGLVGTLAPFEKMATELGKGEFVEKPALDFLIRPRPSDWNKPEWGLYNLSHVVRLARKATDEQLRAFIDRIAKPDRIDSWFYGAPSAGSIAGSMYAIFKSLPDDIVHRFGRQALMDRVSHALREARDPETRAEALSLLGVARLMRLDCATSCVVWPNARDLEEVLRLRAPAPEQGTAGHLEVQLWNGLHAMAGETEKSVPIPPELGDSALALFRAAQAQPDDKALPEKIHQNIDEMIPWLETCQSNGWRLLPPRKTA